LNGVGISVPYTAEVSYKNAVISLEGDLSFTVIKTYEVIIADGIIVKDGETVINSGERVVYGTVLTVTADPKTGHTSKLSATAGDIGEDGSYTVIGAVEFVVEYTAIEYTITWNIEGVTTTTSVAYGIVPAYTGDTPTKAATDEFTYAFDKWTPVFENVTGDTTYVAVFKITEIKASEVEMTADGAESEIDNSVFENLAGDTLTIEVVGEDNVPLYSWKFEGEYKANSMETFTASITESAIGDIEDLLSSVKAENALVLNFAASGELPMNATVRYYVDADKYEDGKILTLFFYNEVTGELEEVGGDLTVTGGYVEFTLSHLSIYVLAESIATPAQDESAGNTMIYIAVGAAILAIIIASVILRRQ